MGNVVFEIVKRLFGISEKAPYAEAANDTADYSDYAAGQLALAHVAGKQPPCSRGLFVLSLVGVNAARNMIFSID